MPLTYYGMTALSYSKSPFHIINIISYFLIMHPDIEFIIFYIRNIDIQKRGNNTQKALLVSEKIRRDKF